MAGCWIMPAKEKTSAAIEDPGAEESAGPAVAQESENNQDKIIVRSNGTVTYVGKDIAYQLWKFGLLGLDFLYELFYTYPAGHLLWITTAVGGNSSAPMFGRAAIVYNVIDARQAYLQN